MRTNIEYLLLRKPSGCKIVWHAADHIDHDLQEAIEHSRETLANEIDPRLDLWNHSPDGFEWGYGGSGPAQTALAILADFTGDDGIAVQLHQRFKRELISGLSRAESMHILEGSEIEAWLRTRPEAALLFQDAN